MSNITSAGHGHAPSTLRGVCKPKTPYSNLKSFLGESADTLKCSKLALHGLCKAYLRRARMPLGGEVVLHLQSPFPFRITDEAGPGVPHCAADMLCGVT